MRDPVDGLLGVARLVLALQVRVQDLLVQRDLLVAARGAVQPLVVLRGLRKEEGRSDMEELLAVTSFNPAGSVALNF